MIRALTPVPGLYRALPLHPDDEDDPYVFRLDLSELGMSSVRVVFGRDAASGAAAIHAEADLGGTVAAQATRAREARTSLAAAMSPGAASATIRGGRGVRRTSHRGVATERHEAGRGHQGEAGAQPVQLFH